MINRCFHNLLYWLESFGERKNLRRIYQTNQRKLLCRFVKPVLASQCYHKSKGQIEKTAMFV